MAFRRKYSRTCWLGIYAFARSLLCRLGLAVCPYLWMSYFSSPSSPSGSPLLLRCPKSINERWVKNIYADGPVTMSDRTTNLIWLYDASMFGGGVGTVDTGNHFWVWSCRLTSTDADARRLPSGGVDALTGIDASRWASMSLEKDRPGA
jgi:hypothetical protein